MPVDDPELWGTDTWPFDVNEYEHLRLTIVDVASGKQLCEVIPAESLIDFTETNHTSCSTQTIKWQSQ